MINKYILTKKMFINLKGGGIDDIKVCGIPVPEIITKYSENDKKIIYKITDDVKTMIQQANVDLKFDTEICEIHKAVTINLLDGKKKYNICHINLYNGIFIYLQTFANNPFFSLGFKVLDINQCKILLIYLLIKNALMYSCKIEQRKLNMVTHKKRWTPLYCLWIRKLLTLDRHTNTNYEITCEPENAIYNEHIIVPRAERTIYGISTGWIELGDMMIERMRTQTLTGSIIDLGSGNGMMSNKVAEFLKLKVIKIEKREMKDTFIPLELPSVNDRPDFKNASEVIVSDMTDIHTIMVVWPSPVSPDYDPDTTVEDLKQLCNPTESKINRIYILFAYDGGSGSSETIDMIRQSREPLGVVIGTKHFSCTHEQQTFKQNIVEIFGMIDKIEHRIIDFVELTETLLIVPVGGI